MRRKMNLRERLERVFDRKTWEANNAPVPQATIESMWNDYRREYHAQTLTALYIKNYRPD